MLLCSASMRNSALSPRETKVPAKSRDTSSCSISVDVSDLYPPAPKPNPGADFMGCHRFSPVASCWDGRSLERTARWPSGHVLRQHSFVSEIVEIDVDPRMRVSSSSVDFENAVHGYLQLFGVRGGGPGRAAARFRTLLVAAGRHGLDDFRVGEVGALCSEFR